MAEPKVEIPVRVLHRVVVALTKAYESKGDLTLGDRYELAGCSGALRAWMDDDGPAVTEITITNAVLAKIEGETP